MRASLFQKHRAKWMGCKRCPLYKYRSRVVFARGQVPCDVLFIGEAPGVSEDVIGQPFVGPAGKLLDNMIHETRELGLKLAFTNLVACIPKGEDGSKVQDPPKVAITKCAPRLSEFIQIARPKLVVAVGSLAKKEVPNTPDVPSFEFVDIIHPAAILRMDISQQGLAMQRTVVTLTDAMEEL